ncbi:hypothetical protein ACWDQO_17900 [Streptomyces sp. NPDC003703]|uniref:hypothetical protein n=1 Tax=Streptomyces sp. NPDC003283 TaxID=3364681 RepID=UPI0036CCC958
MKKIKAAVLTAAIVAGTALAATPAQALSTCKYGGVPITCEYGIGTYTSQAGVQYEFVVGTDRAAYVRTKTSSSNWSYWSDMGGQWWSGLRPDKVNRGNFEFGVAATGGDGLAWANLYAWDGTRTGWHHIPDPV